MVFYFSSLISDRKTRQCEQNRGGYVPFHERTGVG